MKTGPRAAAKRSIERIVSIHNVDRRRIAINSLTYGYKEVVVDPVEPGKDYVVVADANADPDDADICVLPVNQFRAAESPMVELVGFHTLCADAGDIPGHPLSGYRAGDILPLSVWDHRHRAGGISKKAPVGFLPNNDGMVYDPARDLWVDIYLSSGTRIKTNSAYGGTISSYRKYHDFVADAAAVGKRLMTHEEFSAIAEGSNELSRIEGRQFPDTTGGHRDQNGRRMISNIGCEDCCGVVWQWLSTPDPDDPDEYFLIAGGNWADAAFAGSRCRYALYYRWYTDSYIGARFVAEPLNRRT